jgi:hypothetical protein
MQPAISAYLKGAVFGFAAFGDVLFLFAAFLTACFTVVMRQAKLDPLHVAALVSTGSLYGRAVAILGASGGAAFGALVPALSALLAIPLLDE